MKHSVNLNWAKLLATPIMLAGLSIILETARLPDEIKQNHPITLITGLSVGVAVFLIGLVCLFSDIFSDKDLIEIKHVK